MYLKQFFSILLILIGAFYMGACNKENSLPDKPDEPGDDEDTTTVPVPCDSTVSVLLKPVDSVNQVVQRYIFLRDEWSFDLTDSSNAYIITNQADLDKYCFTSLSYKVNFDKYIILTGYIKTDWSETTPQQIVMNRCGRLMWQVIVNGVEPYRIRLRNTVKFIIAVPKPPDYKSTELLLSVNPAKTGLRPDTYDHLPDCGKVLYYDTALTRQLAYNAKMDSSVEYTGFFTRLVHIKTKAEYNGWVKKHVNTSVLPLIDFQTYDVLFVMQSMAQGGGVRKQQYVDSCGTYIVVNHFNIHGPTTPTYWNAYMVVPKVPEGQVIKAVSIIY